MRTPSQTVGPFFAFSLCDRPANHLAPLDAPDGVRIHGAVFDGAREPVSDALVEIWHPRAGFGRCGTDAEGRFDFLTRKPPHLNVMVFARGLLKPVVTRLYFPDGERDDVLDSVDESRRPALVAEREDGAYRFDIHLQGERETVFFEL